MSAEARPSSTKEKLKNSPVAFIKELGRTRLKTFKRTALSAAFAISAFVAAPAILSPVQADEINKRSELTPIALSTPIPTATPVPIILSEDQGCSFIEGFAEFREKVGAEIVGDCATDEIHTEVDSIQHTIDKQGNYGLLSYNKLTQRKTFTDGGRTWVETTQNILTRNNNFRFPVEEKNLSLAEEVTIIAREEAARARATQTNPNNEASRLQTAQPTIGRRSWSGTASYYSEAGCIGCRADRLMANGQRFRDSGMTIAFMRAPLGTTVTITNTSNGRTTNATITDRGGFESRGWIADLSPAVKNSIGCSDLCSVIITQN